ncbi:vWA domain-containing protein [Thioflexithrix psekupsensis]|uniref:VWFA domain-containing protein n=1 Tax=Thioflexithrix psekupsensis TaxID=1570016 RepID=A0A251XA81_9GAMM|nr:vWA domain-containing protein [Thioflexithrix psekupsensis]OUD15341.1 hypothetical protein TPSD3_02085 [Thioflexithrix psekupsensis]
MPTLRFSHSYPFMIGSLLLHASIAPQVFAQEACTAPVFDPSNFDLRFSCVSYEGQHFRFDLKKAQLPGQALSWKLDTDSAGSPTCDTNAGGCVVVGKDLRLAFGGLQLANAPYGIILNFTPNPDDPNGLYWSYNKHYAEQAQTPSNTVTSTDITDPNATTPISREINYKVYDVRVSYYGSYAQAMQQKAAIEDNILHFADGVYEASNGAQKLGRVTIYTDGGYADNTDILWVLKCHPNAHVAGRGNKGSRVEHCDTFQQDNDLLIKTRIGGYTLLHEWGHFFYGLMDEYQGSGTACDAESPTSPCDSDVPVDKSAMHQTDNAVNVENNSLVAPIWLNFSTALNFDPSGGKTAQAHVYGKSGWDTLLSDPSTDRKNIGRAFYPELAAVKPEPGRLPTVELGTEEATQKARSDLKIEWKQGATQAERTQLRATRDGHETQANDEVFLVRQFVIDTSAAMSIKDLEAIKATLQSLVSRAESDEVIGIVTFSDTPNVLVPPTRVSSAQQRQHLIDQIKTIKQEPKATALGNALDRAQMDLLAGQFSDEANWLVYLFASGKNTTGLSPESVTRSYRDEGILLMSFITEKNVNSELDELSRATGGGYWTIEDTNRLAELIAEAEAEASPEVVTTVAMGYKEITGQDAFSFFLDNTLSTAEITVSYFGSSAMVTSQLIAPDGSVIEIPEDQCEVADIEAEEEGQDADNYYYCWFDVALPMEGAWQLQVNSDNPVGVEYYVDGLPKDNSNTYFAIVTTSDDEEYVTPGSTVTLHAKLSGKLPITELPLTAVMEGEYGEKTVSFRDDGVAPDHKANDGEYVAVIDAIEAGYHFITVNFDNSAGTAKYSNHGVSYYNAPGNFFSIPKRELETVATRFQRAAYTQLIAE